MKKTKKIISVLTALMMSLSMVMSVSAAETGTVTVQTIGVTNSDNFEAKDIFTISNVLAKTTSIHHRYDVNFETECPVYICTGDFEVTLLTDLRNCSAYSLVFNEKYTDASTGRTLENVYVTSNTHKIEKTAGSVFTRPEESKRPKGEEVYAIKGASGSNFGAVIKVVDNYIPAEGDIPVSELTSTVTDDAEAPTEEVTTTDDAETPAEEVTTTDDAETPAEEVTPTEVAAPAEHVTALPTTSKVYIDGESEGFNFDAYNIADHNYFKLRDLGYRLTELNGGYAPFTGFNVGWDEATHSIQITEGEEYTAVGGEMASGDGIVKEGDLFKSPVLMNGNAVELTAYIIDGSSYFMLQDICRVLNYNVQWDGETNSISILTQMGYYD